MLKFKVTGMSCAACSSRVERAVNDLELVSGCNVNLLTGDLTVEGDISAEQITQAVISAGYGIQQVGKKADKNSQAQNDVTNKSIIYRLIISAALLLILMYFSMGHTMWGFKVPKFFEGNYTAITLLQLLLTTAVMVINQRFFINGFKGLIKRAPNMDTLVSLGSLAAYGYSCYNAFLMTTATDEAAKHLMHNLYFESAAMILTLITVGKLLEGYAKGKTTNAIKALLDLAPKTATVIRDGKEIIIDAQSVSKDDIFVVKAGESFATDGVIIEGSSAVDEAALTGEGIPIDKTAGDRVYSATVNKTGRLICRATSDFEGNTLSQIVKMVSDASATKAPIARIADRVSAVFVPAVLGIALVTLIVWLLLGRSVGFALSNAISVLVISCPCALGLATPVAIMVGSGVGAKHGILFKTAASLEMCGKCNIVLLDKTGTITEGSPTVTDVILLNGTDQNELLKIAYTIEKSSAHPLARAVCDYAEKIGTVSLQATDFKELAGSGVSAVIEGKKCFAGSVSAISEAVKLSGGILEKTDALSNEAKTPICFACQNRIIGIIAVEDAIKPDSSAAIKRLKKLGNRVIMLTGDNQKTAFAVADRVGISEIKAGVKPDGKALVVKELQNEGRVIMVGDGINDAVALTAADIGMAISSGMDIAVQSADVVLMNSSLSDVVDAVRISRKTLKNIRENLFWAFIYNTLGIPLAAGVFVSALGWQLNPMFGAAAMSLSSFCVVTNALRLNFFKTNKKSKERKQKIMKKTIKIEGMMCPHCEAHVKSALEGISGVVTASASHTDGAAVVEMSEAIDNAVLKSTVESQGYKVISIE